MPFSKDGSQVKYRFIERDDHIEFAALFNHPMRMGYGKDKDGNPHGPEFIQSVRLYIDDRLSAELELTPWISKQPFISFKIAVVAEDAPFRIEWRDNNHYTNEYRGTVKYHQK